MGDRLAAALVFGSSASVLVVEIVALRLLAPYLGLTLEMNTLVIGIALAAIAAGAWLGGAWADAADPRPRVPVLLAVSGAVVAATPFLVRAAAGAADGALLMVASAGTILVPGVLLSAVSPIVVKLRLRSLAETGSVVGRLSGIGTAGAILGTVLTGFVLISRVPVSWILVGLGILLVVAAVALATHHRRRMAAGATAVALLGGLLAATLPSGCDAETSYHCAEILPDDDGGYLVLDGLRHSYVAKDDPTHLEFQYTKALGAALDAHLPRPAPVQAHHLGAGALTMPRWLAATRPGSRSTVSEIDGGVVAAAHEQLGVPTGDGIEVRIEDARVGLRRVGDGSQRLVVGDAFGGVSVPWHLATREWLTDVRRVLRPDGLYAANLIDHGSLAFARAEVATLREVFPYVAVAATGPTLRRQDGGNLVALASRRPLDPVGWQRAADTAGLEWQVLSGDEVARWIGDAQVLTDDYAPVDQLLTPYG